MDIAHDVKNKCTHISICIVQKDNMTENQLPHLKEHVQVG